MIHSSNDCLLLRLWVILWSLAMLCRPVLASYQGATPLDVALYHIPNAIVGVLATWAVSRTIHIVPGHYIPAVSMLAFTLAQRFSSHRHPMPCIGSSLFWG